MRSVVLILFLAALPLAGQTSKWTLPLFTSDPQAVYQAAKATKGPRDAGAYMIDLDMQFRVDDTGKMRWVQRSVTRIVDERGVRQFGTIVVPWQSWRQDRPRLRARVITRNGVAHDLDAGSIMDGAVSHGGGQLITDTKAISAPLPAVQIDSVIELELEQDDKGTVFPGGQFLRYPVTQSVTVLHYRVAVQSPPNSPFKAIPADLAGALRKEERTPEFRTVTFEGVDLTPHPKGMLPPDQMNVPTVEISSGVTWRNLAAWYSQVVDDRAGAPASHELAPPDAAPKIAAILEDIQANVRYTGVELGAGAYMPRRPEDTLKRGYGDCKDKSALLIQRLRAQGIPAYMALLAPYPQPDANPELPGIENFSHAIVFVPGEHPLWIDPTAEYTPVTRLPYVDQGRYALIARPTTTQLVRTPQSPAAENFTRYEVTIRLQPEGESRYEMVEDEAGAFEELIRPMAALSPERVRELKGAGLKRKIDVALSDPRDLSKPYRMLVSGDGYEAARTEGQHAWADVSPLGVDMGFLAGIAGDSSLMRDVETGVGARTEDYCVPVLFTEEMEKHIIPPPGFHMRWPPALPWLQVGPLTLARTAKLDEDGSVRLTYRLVSTKHCYTVAEARSIAHEIHQLSTSRDATVRIEFTRGTP